MSGPALEVLDPGALCTVQDLGRPGLGRLAVGPSGAFDRGALRLANRLVGNDEGAAALEAVLVGPRLRALRATSVCVTGALGPLTVDGHPVDRGSPIALHAGQVLEVGPAARGLRAYVAVRGGVAVRPVLGSASTDTLSGLGPPPLRATDVVAAGTRVRGPVSVDHVPLRRHPDRLVLRVVLGPDDDRVGPAGLATLLGATFAVGADSNRVGLRLDGPAVTRLDGSELPSAPTVRGALQVPPDGRPVLLGPDHPVTGGYPVAAVVVDDDLDGCAQLRPGDFVAFAPR
jgi:biotin-dependent carboxylase-like uncharacterized protein